MITGTKDDRLHDVPIFAFVRPRQAGRSLNYSSLTVCFSSRSGFVSVYGDSNCLETASGPQAGRGCFFLLDALLQFAATGELPTVFRDSLKAVYPPYLLSHILVPITG